MDKKKFDYVLLIAVIIISVFGITMIYSASSIWAEFKFHDALKYVKHQSLFFIVGIVILLISSKMDIEFLKKKANLILGVCLILLILVLIPGIGSVRNGSRSWFGIGGLGIQPSEFAKIGLIIYTAKYLSRNQKNMKDIKKGALPIFLVIGVFFLLIMLEPDFGTAMVITLTLICLIFISGLKISFFVKLGLLGILGIVGLIIAAPYRMARIISFLNPWSDPLGSGYQIIQSLYAIGPGGLLGQGFMNSRQKHFYLPEPQTDFIFSIISEEFGFMGVIIVCSFFFLIFYRMLKVAMSSNDLFKKYLAFGLAFGIFIQAGLNLAVVVGLIPVTGVTLPFFSYGGSSLLVSMLSVGLVLNISRR
ncbi:MAG: putative lipid II flippase FtsW [Bacilli bacterium]|jgi:cell division protein FtsW|nr:putative lipid II flippase FtsW [Bacilli bacterium]MCX4253960.1 putative lipid II flippase FtsW [Bacilli bacterium]